MHGVVFAPMARKKRTLGFAPPEHLLRANIFIRQAKDKRAEFDSSIREKNCEGAFANLIDLAIYNGMAEAELEGSGESGKDRARHTVRAVRAFREACKIK